MSDNQDTLNKIRDKVFRSRVTETLGDAATDTTVDALLSIAEKYATSAVQERDHYRGVIARMSDAQRRQAAIISLATAITWTAADGTEVRIEPGTDAPEDVRFTVGTDLCWADSVDTAVRTAARAAPPADPDLAALLTWTACVKAQG